MSGGAFLRSFNDIVLKVEYIFRHKLATFSEVNEMFERYIHFYYHEQI